MKLFGFAATFALCMASELSVTQDQLQVYSEFIVEFEKCNDASHVTKTPHNVLDCKNHLCRDTEEYFDLECEHKYTNHTDIDNCKHDVDQFKYDCFALAHSREPILQISDLE